MAKEINKSNLRSQHTDVYQCNGARQLDTVTLVAIAGDIIPVSYLNSLRPSDAYMRQ